MSCIILIGDAHFRDPDPEVDAFVKFLDTLPRSASSLYLLGDLFDLWIAAPPFITAAHRRVVEALCGLREKGLRVSYIEGNRDYHLRSTYRGSPFHDLEEDHLEVAFGTRRLFLAHGDRVNRKDRPYRLWRWVAKGPVPMRLLRLVPARQAARLTRRLERGIARTNVRHRTGFPEEACRDYALKQRRAGFDTVVLGHFHRELERTYETPEGKVQLFVLPTWREGRRYLKITADGAAVFESFEPAAAG